LIQQTAIITDSLACLTPELAEKYGIHVVPLSFMLKGHVYRDWVDISPSKAYELFLEDPNSFQSSAPSPVQFLDAFRDAAKTAANILCITLSNILSTTHSAALIAMKQFQLESPGTRIEIFDSYTTTAAEGFVALAAARAAVAGKDFAGVVKAAETIRSKVEIVAVLDTIKHVYRSGRIPKIASTIGSVLAVRPLLYIKTDNQGAVRFAGIVRTRQAGIDKIIGMMRQKAGDSPLHLAVMHAYTPELALEVRDRIVREFNCAEIWITEFSPLMGYAVGTGALGLAFYGES
jgi:DegV family protein with EDD domain